MSALLIRSTNYPRFLSCSLFITVSLFAPAHPFITGHVFMFKLLFYFQMFVQRGHRNPDKPKEQ